MERLLLRETLMLTTATPVLPTLRASKLFGGLDERLLAEFARAAHRARFARGDFLWRAGDPAMAITVITSGLVKICQPLRQGQSTIVGLFGPRESLGDMAVIGRMGYPADALAASDSVEILRVEKTAVLDAMHRHPAVGIAINRSLVEHSNQLRGKIQILAAGSVERRLATLLVHLAERFGDELEDGCTGIPVVLSRTELACLVGTTVETTIRIMSRWQKAGLVETTADGFRLCNVEAMEALETASSPAA